MKSFYLLTMVFFCTLTQAQVIYTDIPSEVLGETRQLKVQLPRNYDDNPEKRYPVILTLDGDYLFEPIAGNVDYFSYWEDMPDAIVVGLKQSETRDADSIYDQMSFLPAESGASFFEFIARELLPFIDKNYRTAAFRIIAGHDQTANMANYYLLKTPAIFNGYIILSPDSANQMEERLYNALENTQQKIFYYLATGTEDIGPLKEGTTALNQMLQTVTNPNVSYTFDNFENATHYSLAARAIPRALEETFKIYRPISKKEYKEVILKLPGSAYDYLVEKYATIESLFGIKQQISVNDFTAVFTAIKKKSDWESLEKLGKLASKQYPEAMLGSYYTAMFYEQTGSPKKAMRIYQSAYLLDEIGNLTKDLMLDKADAIKADFGY